MWESHLLRPLIYRNTWSRLVGQVVDHRIEPLTCMHVKARENTEKVWTQHFGQSMQSTELVSDGISLAIPQRLRSWIPSLGITARDVIEDRNWWTFFSRYCGDVEVNDELLNRSRMGYIRFLTLVRSLASLPSAMLIMRSAASIGKIPASRWNPTT